MSNFTGFEIAVIGMAGRFPGAKNIHHFWNNLKNGVESIQKFSEAELLAEGASSTEVNEPSYVRSNAFLEHKEYFDSLFFDYTPDEAKLMDPQMRILHECVWQAIEDAGYNALDSKSKIGLFTGATTNLNWLNYSTIENLKNLIDTYSLSHINDVNFNNTMISYRMNLRGPSVTVNTACSTSLAAIHQACNSLLLGECRMAVAGGVTINNFSKRGYTYQDGMINSQDGHCRSFDAKASGTVGGEGVGVVVLKRLKKALEDKDNIYAIIKGTGLNNDGNNKVGYTAPSVDGQTEVVMMARSMAKIPPESISYVEAHGTATKLGDPIEIDGLNRAFGKSKDKYCALGSVKSNIGHLDSAAGVTGFIKVVLSLMNKQIPPSLHYTQANPQINFKDSPFYVNTELKEWKNEKYPLRGAVSSFGIGGTNAHIILEEAPKETLGSKSRNHQVLFVSGKTQTSLQRNIANITSVLAENKGAAFPDIAYTLNMGRKAFKYRKMCVVSDKKEALEALKKFSPEEKISPVKDRPALVFMFSGQGAQYVNMARNLYEEEAVFREEIDDCLNLVKRIYRKDLKPVIFPSCWDEKSADINQTEFTQPCLFIIQYALAKLLLKWGIKPNYLIGHSIGEYTAACVSGVFSLEDALSIVIRRGELMQGVKPGKMLSISISEENLKPLLLDCPEISLAAVNSSELCVVSGEERGILNFQKKLEGLEIQHKILHTSHAFHSHMMDEILPEFEHFLNQITIHKPQIPFISNLTGERASFEEIANPKYWSEHLRGTVKFADGISSLLEKNDVFVEIGPGKGLNTFVSAHKNRERSHKVVSCLRHPRVDIHDQRYLLAALGELWLHGVEIDWEVFYEKETRRRVPLPTYSFDKIKYPVLVDSFSMINDMIADGKERKNKKITHWFYAPTWKLAPRRIQSQVSQKGNTCLIFLDQFGLAEEFSQRFKQNGGKTILVEIGDHFEKKSLYSYSLRPGSEEDYLTLFKQLAEDNLLPNRWVHAWGVSIDQKPNGNGSAKRGWEAVSDTYESSFYSLINTMKAANEYGGLLGKEITVISNGLHNIIDEERVEPVKSMVLGLLKVIPQEYPSILTKHIDISLSESRGDAYCESIYQEIIAREAGKVVSFRNAKRWEQGFEKLRGIEPEFSSKLVGNGVYLISGGLGNMGYTFASHLAEKYQAKLMLLGRTSLGPKKEWDARLQDQNTSQGIRDKIQKLKRLEAKGGEIHYVTCNIANGEELQSAVEKFEEQNGKIQGLIHAAGVLEGKSFRLLNKLSYEDYQTQIEPKIKGLHVLDTVFKDRDIDFCLLTSSLSTTLGGINYAAYASVNTYFNYFPKSHPQRLSNWISVNLDGLNFEQDTSEVIDPQELIQVIDLSLTLKESDISVSTTDLYKRIDKWVNLSGLSDEDQEDDGESFEGQLEGEELDFISKGLTETEGKLLYLWQHFFGKKDVEIEDNFFEIGGDSLKALSMIGRIHKSFQIEVGIKEFFENSSIKELAAFIEKPQEKSIEPLTRKIDKIPQQELYLASPQQERMYFQHLLHKESTVLNLSAPLEIKGEIDPIHIEQTFRKLLERHGNLRSSFLMTDQGVMLRINKNFQFKLEELSADRYDKVEDAYRDFIRPFDLAEESLFRVALLRDEKLGNYLFIDMHHIISDRISFDVLLSDFKKIHLGEDLSPLALRYVDYANWLKTDNPELSTQEEFWKNKLSGEFARADLPILRERDEIDIQKVSHMNLVLDKEMSKRVRELLGQKGASSFMFFLSVYYIFLSKITGMSDVIIGSEVLGRTQDELRAIIGNFVNILPLRLEVNPDEPFLDFLNKVRDCVLEGFSNQDFQFDNMLPFVNETLEPNRNPIFDTYFSYSNKQESEGENELEELAFTPISFNESPRAQTELTLSLKEDNDTFTLSFIYYSDLYDEEMIKSFTGYFRNIVLGILDNENIVLQHIEIERATQLINM